MSGYYDALLDLNPNSDNRMRLVVSGPEMGEKVLITNGKTVYDSADGKESFFRCHPEEAAGYPENGLAETEGRLIYSERIGNEKKVVICGAGHVAIAIERVALMIGCEVTVIDDRPSFCKNAEEAGADRVICDTFERALDEVEGDGDTYFVIVTRGHKWDKECLRAIAGKPHAYIGLMGSRRRVAIVKRALLDEGIAKEVLDHLHSPIGLPIGAETPEEIAVSILAEIIEVKNKKEQKIGYPSDILAAMFGMHGTPLVPGPMVLALIIRRRGSAPRETGTKMLIRADGSCVGTIGGGCVEAEIISKARRMIQTENFTPAVVRVDLTAEAAADEGEVCGGTVDVYLEQAGSGV